MFRNSKSIEPATETTAEKNAPRYSPRIGRLAIPEQRWNDEPLRCLQVNDEWVSHIIGVLNVLDQGDTWAGTDEEIADARQQVNEIILAFMEGCDPLMACCPTPIIQINADGSISVSYDGGVTYTPATTEDPRTTAPKLPPVDDGDADKKCKAANRVVAQLQELQTQWADQLGAGLTIVQLSLALAAALIAAFWTGGVTIGLIAPILLNLAAAIAGTGKEAYNDLFTDDIWNTLLCDIYCSVGEDGQFTTSQFNDLRSQLDTDFSGTVALAFSSALNAWQVDGLNNAAKVPTSLNMACDDCDCNRTCSSKYTVGGDGYGELLSSTEDTITVNAVYDGRVGGYAAGLIAKNKDKCCLITFDLISGTITSGAKGYANCGETPNPDAFNHFDITTGGCFSMFVLISTAPFQVVFNLNPCE